MICTPTPPFGRIGSSSIGNTSRASEERAAIWVLWKYLLKIQAATFCPFRDAHEVLALPGLAGEVAQLAQEAVARAVGDQQAGVAAPRPIQTMSSEPELMRVFIGAPSPRPEGSAAASTLKALPPEASTVSVSVVLHSSSR